MKRENKRAWYESVLVYCVVSGLGLFGLSLFFYFLGEYWFALSILLPVALNAILGLLSYNKVKEYND